MRETLLHGLLHDTFNMLQIIGHNACSKAIAAGDEARAGDGNERDGLGVARLKADGGASSNVQPIAVGSLSVELELRIGLDEVIVRTYLDWPVPRAGHLQPDPLAVPIQHDLGIRSYNSTRLPGRLVLCSIRKGEDFIIKLVKLTEEEKVTN